MTFVGPVPLEDRPRVWGAHAPRVRVSAPPAETNLLIDWNIARAFSAVFRVRDREGAITSTRGRVRSLESRARATWLRGRSDVPRSRSSGCDCLPHAAVAGRSHAAARDSVLECGGALPLSLTAVISQVRPVVHCGFLQQEAAFVFSAKGAVSCRPAAARI